MGIQVMTDAEVKAMRDREVLEGLLLLCSDYSYYFKKQNINPEEYFGTPELRLRFRELKEEVWQARRQSASPKPEAKTVSLQNLRT